jgi:hypothetical protein
MLGQDIYLEHRSLIFVRILDGTNQFFKKKRHSHEVRDLVNYIRRNYFISIMGNN